MNIYKEFDEKAKNVFIGFSEDGEYNRYLNGIDKEGTKFIKSFLKAKIKEAKLQVLDECIKGEAVEGWCKDDPEEKMKLEFYLKGYNQKRQKIKELKKKYEMC